jgi:hypothetical protein
MYLKLVFSGVFAKEYKESQRLSYCIHLLKRARPLLLTSQKRDCHYLDYKDLPLRGSPFDLWTLTLIQPTYLHGVSISLH